MRVLMLGAGERYHLEPLARCIKAAAPETILEVNGLREPGPDSRPRPVLSSPVFDRLHHSPSKQGTREQPPAAPAPQAPPPAARETSQAPFVSSLPPLRGRGLAARLLERATRGSEGFFEPWQLALRATWNLYRSRRCPRREVEHLEKIAGPADVLHLQSLFEYNVNRWLLHSRRTGFVVSCWGSDVLRDTQLDNHIVHRILLDRAGVITLTGTDFREAFLAKFGRHLQPKIVSTFFDPGVGPLRPFLRSADELAKAGNEAPLRVCVGHNGFEGGNHLALLSGFTALAPELKARIELIVPMTYGGSPGYRAQIKEAAQNTGCKLRILETFLDDEAVRRLRAEIDVLIFAPVSDVLAATVTQALACASWVITGAWLPNGVRARAGFSFAEIERPEDAAAALSAAWLEWPASQERRLRNRALAFELFSEKSLGQGWVSAYETALRARIHPSSCKQ